MLKLWNSILMVAFVTAMFSAPANAKFEITSSADLQPCKDALEPYVHGFEVLPADEVIVLQLKQGDQAVKISEVLDALDTYFTSLTYVLSTQQGEELDKLLEGGVWSQYFGALDSLTVARDRWRDPIKRRGKEGRQTLMVGYNGFYKAWMISGLCQTDVLLQIIKKIVADSLAKIPAAKHP